MGIYPTIFSVCQLIWGSFKIKFVAKQINMQPTIGFNEKVMAEVAHKLLPIVADEFLLFVKTRNAHWNVEGIDFHAKHLFFEEQFNQLDDLMDGHCVVARMPAVEEVIIATVA